MNHLTWLLDLVITDDPDQILSIDHLPPIGASDHVCLLTTLRLSPPSSDHICRRYIDYEKKYRQNNSREHYDKFKKTRKITRYFIRKHEDIIATETKTNPKKYWNYASSAKPRRHFIPYLTTPSGKIIDHAEIAETLNKQYSSVYTVENSRNIPDTWEYPVNVTIPMVVIFESDVQKQLKKLDTSKSKGPNGIHSRLLKETAELKSSPLAKIFKKSLKEKVFPSDWKKLLLYQYTRKAPKTKLKIIGQYVKHQ